MEIIKYDRKYSEDVKNLLVELQEYIVSIDNWHLNILTPQYRKLYFEKTMKECGKNKGVMFLAKENNKIIGMICGHLSVYDKYDRADYKCLKSGIIEELIVSQYARASGVGMTLMEKIETYFKELDCQYCHVAVFEPNTLARKFYAKNGYAERLINLSKKL